MPRRTQVPAAPRSDFGYGGVTLFAAPSLTLRLSSLGAYRRSYNPASAAVWAPPRSLATTYGIVLTFLSWRY